MVLNLSIETGSFTRFRQSNGQIMENAPKIETETSKNIADDLEDAIKESVDKTFSQASTGNLKQNVEASREEAGKYTVSANAYNDGVNYAAWHEYADTGHFAYYENEDGSENTALVRWAKKLGIFDKTWRVRVTPHSFMKPAVQRAIKKSRRRMRSGKSAPSNAIDRAFN